jgi:hypothetical protein
MINDQKFITDLIITGITGLLALIFVSGIINELIRVLVTKFRSKSKSSSVFTEQTDKTDN